MAHPFAVVTSYRPCDIAPSMEPTPVPAITISPDQPVPAEFDLLCESCGYSLIGLMVDRCPECGASFDAAALPLARVPWLYRKRLGRASAYIETVKFALLRPRTFAAELCRPVRISAQDAHRFRLVTIGIASFSVALGLAGLLQFIVGFWPPRPMTAGLLAICAGVWLGMFVFLRMATDLPTFIWRGLPGRSDDLSPLHEYAAAPLVLMLPGAIVFAGLVLVLGRVMVRRDHLTVEGTLTALAIGAGVLLWTWLAALVFMRAATRPPWRRLVLLACYLPVHWLMMWLLVVMFIGAVAYYGGAVLNWLNVL